MLVTRWLLPCAVLLASWFHTADSEVSEVEVEDISYVDENAEAEQLAAYLAQDLMNGADHDRDGKATEDQIIDTVIHDHGGIENRTNMEAYMAMVNKVEWIERYFFMRDTNQDRHHDMDELTELMRRYVRLYGLQVA
eukprot:TRINITY_DN49584_c0_g1_i1.p1 TRINITY_DN49584_c0_g1~~TRINITY_DN49584_c0_g1_i1.p1  ORF type:complete len:137 (-),score=13.39 TRINITY_DN49584_c0_g1_i1:137-547(-)